MLAHSDLQRSLRAMTIGYAQAMHRRRHMADDYGLAERVQQFQYELTGYIGDLPVEATIPIRFALMFMADSGNQRDSTLDRPHVHVGFEEEYAPAGTIPYAKVISWIQDDDFNYVGANVLVGVHCPAVAIEGLVVNQARVKIALHISFQGWGAMIDPDGDYDAGGNIDIPNWSGTTH